MDQENPLPEIDELIRWFTNDQVAEYSFENNTSYENPQCNSGSLDEMMDAFENPQCNSGDLYEIMDNFVLEEVAGFADNLMSGVGLEGLDEPEKESLNQITTVQEPVQSKRRGRPRKHPIKTEKRPRGRPPLDLTPEVRLEQRRARERSSAKRYRQKQKSNLKTLESELTRLESEIKWFKMEIERKEILESNLKEKLNQVSYHREK